MKENDIRYIQRFENYEKSFLLLKEALSLKSPTIFEKAGIIQFFEMTFELSWKLLKDYLQEEGYNVKSPRDAIKTAFSVELIDEGGLWLEALKDRNLTTHTYEEDVALEIEKKIKNEYFRLLESLYNTFKEKICTD